MYSFCMEPQPNTCQSLSEHELVSTTVLSQCTNSITIHTKEITYLATTVYTPTTVQVSVCPSPTTSVYSHILIKSSTNTSCPSSTTCSPTDTIQKSEIPLNIAISATGALVGLLIVLLLVVISGWVCTFRIMKKRGKMEINMMQDR